MAATRCASPQGREIHHRSFLEIREQCGRDPGGRRRAVIMHVSPAVHSWYAVFNAAQVDGYTPKPEPEPTIAERIQRADTFFQAVGGKVKHGGNQAYYSPTSDYIQMPPFQAF